MDDKNVLYIFHTVITLESCLSVNPPWNRREPPWNRRETTVQQPYKRHEFRETAVNPPWKRRETAVNSTWNRRET